jgi:transposase-like protein
MSARCDQHQPSGLVDPAGPLDDALTDASPDLMRSLLQTMINALLSADADAVVGVEYTRPSRAMTGRRSATTATDLCTPGRKDREIALTTVVAACYLYLASPAALTTRRT